MSFVDDLLIILSSYSGGYKLIWQRISEPTRPDHKLRRQNVIKNSTLRNTLSRLKKRGLVANDNKIWKISRQGSEYLKCRALKKNLPHFDYLASLKNRKKNMIIAFDIPEVHRKKRDWLRFELINLGFTPLQKSVWFGPAPLPKEFIKTLNEFNIINFVKFFRVTEKDLI